MSWRNALQIEKHTYDADIPLNIILSSENTPKISPTFMCTFQAGDHINVENYEGEIKILPITEIVTENEFFDYAAKYEGKADEITPALLPLEMEQAVCATIKKIYTKLGLKGITRSEFIFVSGIPHLLEINTVPGLTEKSIVPQQVEAAGISLSDFFDGLLKTALNIK